MQSGLTTNSGITTNAAGFPGCGMISSPKLSSGLDDSRPSGPLHLAPQLDHVEIAV